MNRLFLFKPIACIHLSLSEMTSAPFISSDALKRIENPLQMEARSHIKEWETEVELRLIQLYKQELPDTRDVDLTYLNVCPT